MICGMPRTPSPAMCIAQIEKGDTVEIKKVDRGTELADKLLRFVEEFSWEDVKAHMLDELRAWAFTDWETPFAAIINGRIIGIAYIRKSDYYPLPEIYPWVSGIFVTESYRGHRISEKLISFANEYAKERALTRRTSRPCIQGYMKNTDTVISVILLITPMRPTDCMPKKYSMMT